MADRIYSPGEVEAIIERTAERQRRASTAGNTEGLTLAEIEHACREAGLDPALARQSAAELDAGGAVLESGSGATSTAEYWIDGVPTPEGLEDAADHLRVRLGSSIAVGTASGGQPVGAGWEWTHQTLGGLQRTIRVSPRDGRTRVRVMRVDAGFSDARVQGLVAGAILGAVPSVVLGATLAEGLGLHDLVAVAALVLTFLAAVALGGLVLPPRIIRGRQRGAEEARQLAEDVAGWVTAGPTASSRSTSTETPESGQAPVPAPRIDPAHLGAEAEGAGPETSGPRRRTRA